MRLKIISLIFLFMFAFALPAFAQVPDYRVFVQAIFNEGNHNLSTTAGSGCFTEEVAYRLSQIDSNFGHLRKNPGQNQWNGHAVDAILHLPSGRAIDIIASSATPQARPSWQVDIPRYISSDFIAPLAGCQGSGQPPPQPQPPPQQPPQPQPQPPPNSGPPPQSQPGIPQVLSINPNPSQPGEQVSITGINLTQDITLKSAGIFRKKFSELAKTSPSIPFCPGASVNMNSGLNCPLKTILPLTSMAA